MHALITRTIIGMLAALLTGAAPAVARQAASQTAPAQPAGRQPSTDQALPATRGTQLFVNNYAGEIVVHAWERDQVRVQARHSGHVRVDVRQADNAIRVGSSSSSGIASVDYDIRVPAWMPVRISGQFNYVEVEGTQADISAETVRGDVRVKGGSGVIKLQSIEGNVYLEDTKGRLTVSSVNEGVTLVRPSGEVSAETINGDIRITDARANSVQAATVNGDVRFTGVLADAGLYRLNTHQGDIVMGVQDKPNATVSVRTYQGDFRSSFTENTGGDMRRGRRQTFTVGNSGAEVELESFGGDIRLRRISEMPAEKTKDKIKSKDKM